MATTRTPIALAFALAGCAVQPKPATSVAPPSTAADRPTGFPASCAPGEVQVMLLGTFHFQGSSTDAVSGFPMDMRTPARQAELDELAIRLARWAPEQIAVEWPARESARLDSSYARYLANSGRTTSSNEIAQVAFRLARRLGHSTVYAIDQPTTLGGDSLAPLMARRPDLKRRSDSVFARLSADAAAVERAEATSPLAERLWRANTDSSLHAGNSGSMFSYLAVGEGDNRAGPQLLARWYERNFFMAHNLGRVLRPGTQRVLVLVGAGHVPPLRNILDESPEYCPVSPLPYLR